MKILHCVYGLVPGNYKGGIPKIVFELAQAQAAQGHRITIYTTNYNGNNPWKLYENPQVVDFGLVRIYYFKGYRRNVLFSPSMQKSLMLYAAEFDILHTHNIFHPLNQYMRRAADKYELPLFYHTHGCFDPSLWRRKNWKSLKKWFYLNLFELPGLARSQGIWVHTRQEYDQLHRWGPDLPLRIIPNGINYIKTKAPTSSHPKNHVITTLSRIHPKKRIHLLLEAMPFVVDHFPDIQLQILGDENQFPHYTKKLKAAISQYQLEKNVTFLGHQSEADKYQKLAASTLFCQFSYSEGMSISVLEAMSLGVTCLVSKGCHMSAAVQAQALAECPVDQPLEVGHQIVHLLQDHQSRMSIGQRARLHINMEHDWSKVAKEILETYAFHLHV
ncbi:glycosyltransferase [Dyadobacter tibetensis]|uniref:glycosyltransferase n=1 Tax=Dyadobacter tibetensis TaxID=1211851 RepID=UPI0004721D89|nr:glycosyltransferase [Dyadobacter tibetensis]